MVLISLVCSNLTTKISKIFETCKSFLPASEDFVNSATVFVNSATRRGRRAPPGGGSPPPDCPFLNLPEGHVPGRPAENKTAECIAMKDELGGGYKGEIKFGN